MTREIELRPVRVKSGRVHQVKRTWTGKDYTRVKFACGQSTTYGWLGVYNAWSQIWAPDAAITCARCAYSLERAAAKA